MTRLTRDIYVPAGDVGFWQGTFRDPSHGLFVDVMYGDLEDVQRTVTRFALLPRDGGVWLSPAGRVWNIDRADPR